MADNIELQDEKGRNIHPVLMNTAKDGSGTPYFALVDSDGHLQVDSLSALPAGSAAIGKLAANTGVDIGDVDILSIAAGNNNIGDVDVASIAAGTNNIGDVDVASIAAGTNNIGDVDIASALPAGTNAIGRVGHDTTGLGHGVKTVSTVGTDEVMAASTDCKWVIVQAQTDNTSKVAVGASGVDATVATGNGVALDAGDAVTLLVDNLADVYVDALVAGEGVRYTYGS